MMHFKSNASHNEDSLLTIVNRSPKDTNTVNAYLSLSRIYEKTNISSSFEMLNKMEAISVNINHSKGVWLAVFEKANLHYTLDQPDSVLYYTNLIREHREKMSPILQGRYYNLIGIIFQLKQDFDSSIVYFEKSMASYDQTENNEGVITLMNNIGMSYYAINEKHKSLEQFKTCYEMALKYQNSEAILKSANNYAAVSIELGYLDQGEAIFERLVEYAHHEPNPNTKADLLNNIGAYYKEIGNLIEAKKYYEESLTVKVAANVQLEGNTAIGLAQIAYEMGDFDEAKFYFLKADKNEHPSKKVELIYSGLAKTYTASQQPDSATFYWEKYIDHIKKTQKESTVRLLSQAKHKLDLKVKEHEIQQLTQEKELIDLERKNSRILIVSLLILVVMLVTIFWFLRAKQITQKKLKQLELETKNQKLAELALRINQKNEILNELQRKLKDSSLLVENDYDRLIVELTTSLKMAMNMEDDWENFQLYFDDLHHGFYDKLKLQFPNLTDNDLRVCSLLRLRLSSKEIGEMLFLSIESVKSARYRIRKKLNLDKSEKLSDFLSGF